MKRRERILAWLDYAAGHLGGPGLLGLGLLLAALGVDRLLTLPLEESVRHGEARLQRLAAQPRPAAPVASLSERLPTGEAAPEAVARLFAAAGHAGLHLREGGYRVVAQPGGVLRRYQITLPLSGTYPAIRAFLAESLERRPDLALDSLSLRRENIGSPEVEARLGLTLFLREAP